MCKLVPNTIYLFLKRHRRSLNNFVEQWQTTPKHQLVGTLVVLVVVQWPKLPPVNLKIFNRSLVVLSQYDTNLLLFGSVPS